MGRLGAVLLFMLKKTFGSTVGFQQDGLEYQLTSWAQGSQFAHPHPLNASVVWWTVLPWSIV